MNEIHKVHFDYGGAALLPRYTCRTEGCHEATLVRQPFMTEMIWRMRKRSFLAQHPCPESKITRDAGR